MNRWAILAGYGLLAACTQLLWLSFAPITTQAHRAMGVSEGAIGDLAAIFPLMYVILALPTGRWLDLRFEQALSLGAVLTAAGGLLRLVGPTSYGWALAGQVVIAAGQPLVLNSITKVAARYFPGYSGASLLILLGVACGGKATSNSPAVRGQPSRIARRTLRRMRELIRFIPPPTRSPSR